MATSADRDILAEAEAHFAKAIAFWRGWRFIMEIENERLQDAIADKSSTRGHKSLHMKP